MQQIVLASNKRFPESITKIINCYISASKFTFLLAFSNKWIDTWDGSSQRSRDDRKFFFSNPLLYTFVTLLHSTYWGLLWPIFYGKLFCQLIGSI